MKPVIEQISIENFGPIKGATLELSALHALIGPNDSGKSMTLRALWRWADLLTTSLSNVADPLLHHETSFLTELGDTTGLRIRHRWNGGAQRVESFDGMQGPQVEAVFSDLRARRFRSQAKLVRFDPDALRQRRPLLPDGAPFEFMDDRGAGLGRLIDGLFSRNKPEHQRLEDRMKSMFSTIAGFRMFTSGSGERAVGVRLKDGTEIRPEHMSEGLLYFLAFSLLEHMDPPAPVFLVEEPENGLHPARIKEVMRILRDVSTRTQIVLATHSPLVINELQPHEVTLVTRTEAEGTRFTRMDRTPKFAERSSGWNLGELWIALADGVREADLLAPQA
jgi:predicted ATPase